jgi:hypothetical protein
LGGVEYAVWSFCDGTADLAAAVREVAKATGLQVDLLKRRSHYLLVAAVRIKAVFLDQPAPREVPD